jgi:hypothetical protein
VGALIRLSVVGVGAALAIVGAGLKLEHEPAGAPRRLTATASPVVSSARSTPTPTPTPRPSGAAIRVAEAYALEATNWTARTYVASLDRRSRLAGGRLAASMQERPPTPAQLRQLRTDDIARLAAVLRADEKVHGDLTVVRVGVDELHLAIGTRSRQTVTYELGMGRQHGSWRVVAFTEVRSAA